MPKRDPKDAQKFIKTQLKVIEKKQQLELYKECQKMYQDLLSLSPNEPKIVIMYCTCLVELKKFDKFMRTYERAITVRPDDQELYNTYITLLNRNQFYSEAKKIVKRAQKVSQDCNKNPKLVAQYAKACHRSQTFNEGIEMLDWYQNKYKSILIKNENVLLWRVYLAYQVGDYSQAVHYSDIIMTLSDLRADDKEYYQFQKCKYQVLLGKYKQALKLSDIVLSRSDKEPKSKLKIYALKAYSYLKMKQLSLCSITLEHMLKTFPNDTMLQLKWSLLTIVQMDSQKGQPVSSLQSKSIAQRLDWVLKKMQDTTKQNFDDGNFSEHFNWFSQFSDYKGHIENVLILVESPDVSLEKLAIIANLMFLSLIQGYEDCLKTHMKLCKLIQDLEYGIPRKSQKK